MYGVFPSQKVCVCVSSVKESDAVGDKMCGRPRPRAFTYNQSGSPPVKGQFGCQCTDQLVGSARSGTSLHTERREDERRDTIAQSSGPLRACVAGDI